MPTSTVTDKDIEKSREKVEKLRQQLAETTDEVVASESNRNNTVIKARLDAEAERLKAELDAARNRLKASKSTEDRIVEQVQEAVAPPEVDTTPTIATDDDNTPKEK